MHFSKAGKALKGHDVQEPPTKRVTRKKCMTDLSWFVHLLSEQLLNFSGELVHVNRFRKNRNFFIQAVPSPKNNLGTGATEYGLDFRLKFSDFIERFQTVHSRHDQVQ